MANFGAIGRVSTHEQFYAVSTVLSPVAVETVTTPARYQFVPASLWMTGGAAATLNNTFGTYSGWTRRLPTWALDYRGYFQNNTPSGFSNLLNLGYPTSGIPVTGTIQGQVQENGVAVAGRRVFLNYRLTGQPIAQTVSDSSGNYSFSGLEPGVNKYYVTSLNVLPLQYDAVVHDTISAQ